MTILLIAAAWIFVLTVAVGLCMAARRGDAGQQRELAERPLWDLSTPGSAMRVSAQARGHAGEHSPRGVEIAA